MFSFLRCTMLLDVNYWGSFCRTLPKPCLFFSIPTIFILSLRMIALNLSFVLDSLFYISVFLVPFIIHSKWPFDDDGDDDDSLAPPVFLPCQDDGLMKEWDATLLASCWYFHWCGIKRSIYLFSYLSLLSWSQPEYSLSHLFLRILCKNSSHPLIRPINDSWTVFLKHLL